MQVRRMKKSAIRLLALATYAMALVGVPLLTTAYASGDEKPTPPASDTKKEKKKDKSYSIEDSKFLEGYRAAYATVYDHSDYATAIDQLHALGHDDTTAVANLLDYYTHH